MIVNQMANWKAPGSDLVQGFWLKKFSNLHQRIADQLNECISKTSVPPWMTKGRTVLKVKDPQKGNAPSNYRPITCLSVIWKLLTGILTEEVYSFMEEQKMLTEEQKGCKRGSRGTNDLLYIDKKVLKELKQRRKKIAMAWLNYRKAYDLIPHS